MSNNNLSNNDDQLVTLEHKIFEDYAQSTPMSAAWFTRAQRSLVAGVTGNVRYFNPYPLCFSQGDGAQITDIDGNTYIDCAIGSGSLGLGHKPKSVLNSIQKHSDIGSLLLNPKLATLVAENLKEIIPTIEKVRLLNSGTEAVMAALRIARTYTKRSKIIKFYGQYHGMDDQVMVGLMPGLDICSAGVPKEYVSQSIVLEYNNLAVVATALKENKVAAILIDPSMHTAGFLPADDGYFQSLKTLAKRAGALLIFDEVITGFRLAAGGAQEFYDVSPDISVFGKALGAGEKLSVVGGRADIMDVVDPRQPPRDIAFQSGTGTDSTSALAGTIGALQEYKLLGENGSYKTLHDNAERMAKGIQAAFHRQDIACYFNRIGPMVRFFIAEKQSDQHRDDQSKKINAALSAKAGYLFHVAMFSEGVMTLPGSKDFFLSFAHNHNDVTKIITAAERVLDKYDFAVALNQSIHTH